MSRSFSTLLAGAVVLSSVAVQPVFAADVLGAGAGPDCACVTSGAVGSITSASGEVLVSGAAGFEKASAGAPLSVGSSVLVGGSSAANISVGSSCSLSVPANSDVQISALGGGQTCVSIASAGVGAGAGAPAVAASGINPLYLGIGAAVIAGGIIAIATRDDDDPVSN